MPLYDFKCNSCDHKQEHFINQGSSLKKNCPSCSSTEYRRLLPLVQMSIEYSNPKESYDRQIAPHVQDTYAKIGKETTAGDTQTLDNIFGKEKVEKTFVGVDD